MLVHFSAFIGLGSRISLDIKLKSSSGKIILRKDLNFSPERADSWQSQCEILEAFEVYFKEFSEAIHKLGFQKLSAWMDEEIRSFDGEYASTWLWDACAFVVRLNHLELTVDPIL